MVKPSRRWLFCAVVALATGGCLSPTLPLPPPNEPEISGPDATGAVELQGFVEPNAWMYAFNRSSGLGYIQATDTRGHYDFVIQAKVGDPLVLWYQISGQSSETLEFVLLDPSQR